MPAPAPRRLLPVIYVAVFLAALDTAVTAPAIPALRAAFGLDHRAVALVTTVYVLFSLVSTAPMAALGDRHGRRGVFLAGIGLFALGSLMVALAPSFGGLLAGRAVQGVGGGGILPVATAMIGDAFEGPERGRALGLVGAMYGMAFVLGPPVAGLLMVTLSWHWIFLANLPIAVLLLAWGARVLPSARRVEAHPPLDVAGGALLFVVLAAAVLGITRVADDVVGRTVWPLLLALALLLLPVLATIERRARQPMIPPVLLGRRRLALTYALAAGAGFGMGAVVFLTSVASAAHGVEHRHGGFVLLPLVVCSMLGSAGAGRLLARTGPRPQMVAGFAAMALGYAGVAATGAGFAAFLAATLPVGLGVGLVVGGALRSVAIDEAPAEFRAAAQGLINIFTSIGTLLATATIGALADAAGGGARGLSLAYLAVVVLMAACGVLAGALTEAVAAPARPAGH